MAFALKAILSIAMLGDEASRFEISTKNRADLVEVKPMVTRDEKRWIIDVRSPSGIGKATLVRKQNEWPEPLVLRLHLKGLESLRMKLGTTTLNLSVSSTNEEVRVWKNDRELHSLDSKEPLYAQVEIEGLTKTTRSRIPTNVEFIQVTIPKAFLSKDHDSLSLEWIDFYRN